MDFVALRCVHVDVVTMSYCRQLNVELVRRERLLIAACSIRLVIIACRLYGEVLLDVPAFCFCLSRCVNAVDVMRCIHQIITNV
jgi:hypothetical protein